MLLKSNLPDINIEIMHGRKHSRVDQALYHYLPRIDPETTLYLHVSKDIFSWLRSMYRKPYFFFSFSALTFKSFLLHHWNSSEVEYETNENDRWASEDGFYDNIIQLRSIKFQSWLLARSCFRHFQTIRYSDLMTNPEFILEQLREKFDLPFPLQLNTTICFTQEGVCNPTISLDDRTKYYREKKFLEEYDSSTLQILANNIDFEVEKTFGYEYEDLKQNAGKWK